MLWEFVYFYENYGYKCKQEDFIFRLKNTEEYHEYESFTIKKKVTSIWEF